MQRIGIFIFPGVQALDVAGPLDVFSEANGMLPAGQGYTLSTIAAATGPLKASNGMALLPDLSLAEALAPFDLLLAAGGPCLPTAPRNEQVVCWLQAQAAQSPRYGSICNGAFLLGEAGLLDGKQVTTHWQDAPLLAARFPAAKVEQDKIYLRDDRLVTSAGVTAGIDLCLALLAEDHGAELALAVAKRLVVHAQRQGGQSQFSPYLDNHASPSSPIASIQAYVQAHLSAPLTVEKLAQVVAMSPRNFARLFVRDAKVTPAEFVERARVDAARNLLEGTDMALKTVAWHSGLGSVDRMRATFLKRLGVTPRQYRERFHRPTNHF